MQIQHGLGGTCVGRRKWRQFVKYLEATRREKISSNQLIITTREVEWVKTGLVRTDVPRPPRRPPQPGSYRHATVPKPASSLHTIERAINSTLPPPRAPRDNRCSLSIICRQTADEYLTANFNSTVQKYRYSVNRH
ncbi:hypothetical protein J6590_060478 [Homalodisca vitripennis]|nr:hypothetical protein J6590_060478 [Homalodisca vitripennis]